MYVFVFLLRSMEGTNKEGCNSCHFIVLAQALPTRAVNSLRASILSTPGRERNDASRQLVWNRRRRWWTEDSIRKAAFIRCMRISPTPMSDSIDPVLRIASPISILIQDLTCVFEHPEILVAVTGCTHGLVNSMHVRSAKYRPMYGDARVREGHYADQYSNARSSCVM